MRTHPIVHSMQWLARALVFQHIHAKCDILSVEYGKSSAQKKLKPTSNGKRRLNDMATEHEPRYITPRPLFNTIPHICCVPLQCNLSFTLLCLLAARTQRTPSTMHTASEWLVGKTMDRIYYDRVALFYSILLFLRAMRSLPLKLCMAFFAYFHKACT